MSESTRSEFSRVEIAAKILDVMGASRDGYLRNMSHFSTEAENDTAQKCATAVSNAAYFMLQSDAWEIMIDAALQWPPGSADRAGVPLAKD